MYSKDKLHATEVPAGIVPRFPDLAHLTFRLGPLLLLSAALLAHAETPPQFSWARRAGGGGEDTALATAVDSDANVIVAGLFNGNISIGNSNFVSGGVEDIFVAKYDSAGNFLWARQAGGSGYDEGRAVAADASGNIYVAGSFQNTASFGTTNLI